VNFQKQFESLIATLRISGWTIEQIRELFEGSLTNVIFDEKDGENLGKYS
jgi:hypothetical protein